MSETNDVERRRLGGWLVVNTLLAVGAAAIACVFTFVFVLVSVVVAPPLSTVLEAVGWSLPVFPVLAAVGSWVAFARRARRATLWFVAAMWVYLAVAGAGIGAMLVFAPPTPDVSLPAEETPADGKEPR